MIEIFVDADACPVKDEVYDVACRHAVPVVVVANSPIRVPRDLGVEMVVVEEGPDVADDWIAAQVRPHDVVVTADIPLAARCLEAGAAVVGPDGRPFSLDMIGNALATREIKAHMRQSGMTSGGPRPLTSRDRSRFSSALHTLVEAALRAAAGRP
jgi:hypothetical protein